MSDARLARDIQEAEDRAEANAAEEARLRQEEWDSIDRSAHFHLKGILPAENRKEEPGSPPTHNMSLTCQKAMLTDHISLQVHGLWYFSGVTGAVSKLALAYCLFA